MDKLNRDIRHYYYINRFNFKMHGGATREYEITYKGHKLYYNDSPNYNSDINTLFIDGSSGRRPCFHMSIKEKTATLDSLERSADCFVDRHNNTRDLVELAFQIAKTRGCNKFQLTDNSYIICKAGRFYLSDVYFFTTGKTWYESILPIKVVDYDENQMKYFRNLAKTNAWAPISNYLIEKGADLDFLKSKIKDIDIKSKGSAMQVLNLIKSMKNEISCNFFDKQTTNIIIVSGLQRMRGTLWIYESNN